VADANTANLKKMMVEVASSDSRAGLAAKMSKDPKHVNILNREHSSQSNPNALHVLIVEDNLINQKVSP
jgi:CheY-like chemotaxis protein